MTTGHLLTLLAAGGWLGIAIIWIMWEEWRQNPWKKKTRKKKGVDNS